MNKSKKILIVGIVVVLVVIAVAVGYNLLKGSGSIGQIENTILSIKETAPRALGI